MDEIFKHFEQHAVFLCRGDHPIAFGQVHGHGLLYGDVFLCLAGGNGEIAVQMVRNEDFHAGHFWVGQNRLVGIVHLRDAVFGGKALGRLRVFVVHAPELRVLAVFIPRDVERCDTPAANQDKFQFFHRFFLFSRIDSVV